MSDNGFLKKYVIIFSFALCFIFGCLASIFEYKYSEIQNLYWTIFGVSILLFLISKVHLKPIKAKQLLLLLPVLILFFLAWILVPQLYRYGMFLFSTFCFLYLGMLILEAKSTALKVLFLLGYVVCSANILVLLFYVSERSFITRELMNTLFISNSQETKEYLLGKASVIHLLVLLAFLIPSFFIFRNFRQKEHNQNVSLAIFLLFGCSFMLSIFSGPIGALGIEYQHYKRYTAMLKDMIESKNQGKTGVDFAVSHVGEAKKVIIIIGESLNRNYMSLYGYKKDTSPHLKKLKGDTSYGQLFLFNDVISPDVTTVQSLKKVLTNIDNHNGVKFEESVSVVDLFKKAGYKVFWMSNQAPLRDYDTPVAFIGSFADSVHYTINKEGADQKHVVANNHFDSELVHAFKGSIEKEQPEKKQIYFIHLLGSHYNYEDRYPAEFDVFKNGESEVEDRYLNTVLYNDWVVSQIMEVAKKNGADMVCYFSDHGEDLIYNHNQENYKPGMATIPFMVYMANSYLKKNPLLSQAMQANSNTPGMTDNLFNDLHTMTGIRSSLYEPEKSFLAKEYVRKKRMIIDNKVSFDKK